MTILRQLGIILAFGFAGEILSRFLPLGFPASVLGLSLLFLFLVLGIAKQDHLGKTADFLSGHMGFFFLPAAVTILENFWIVKPALLKLLAVVLISTVVTFFITYGTVRLARKFVSSRETKGENPL